MSDRLEMAVATLVDAILEEVRAEVAAKPERLLSVQEAADHLGIGRTRLYQEIGSGRLKSIALGRRRMISSSALAEFVAR